MMMTIHFPRLLGSLIMRVSLRIWCIYSLIFLTFVLADLKHELGRDYYGTWFSIESELRKIGNANKYRINASLYHFQITREYQKFLKMQFCFYTRQTKGYTKE